MFNDARVERIVIATGRTDLRRGIDGLATLIRLNYGRDPLDGTLFLFCGSKKDRIKGLLFEGDGLFFTVCGQDFFGVCGNIINS